MKNLILLFFASIAGISFFSCTKSGSPNMGPAIEDSVPHSFSIYLPQQHSKAVEVFGYDANANLVTIHAYSYDSSGGSPEIDSFLISFTATSNPNPPSSYVELLYFQGDPPAGESEHHDLFYDTQNRVTIDSITMSTINSFTVQHYLYDNNGNTTVQWLFGDPQTPGSYIVNQIDTMFVQNENILTDINYTASDGSLNHLFTRTYSSHPNPLYNTTLANSLGCLLVFNNLFDFRSKNLPSQFTDQESISSVNTINYLWSTDATGNVVKGVGTNANDGTVAQIYSFVY